MKILLTNIFPKKYQPTLGPPGGDSAEGIQNFQKGRQAAPPPLGGVSKPLKKGLISNDVRCLCLERIFAVSRFVLRWRVLVHFVFRWCLGLC